MLSASRLVGFGRGGVGFSFVWVIGSPEGLVASE
jgi:hypothetical protein